MATTTTKKPEPSIDEPNVLTEIFKYAAKRPLKSIFCVLLLIPAIGPAVIEGYAYILLWSQGSNLAGRTKPLYFTNCYISQITGQNASPAGFKACAVTETTRIMSAPAIVWQAGLAALLAILIFYFLVNTNYLGYRKRKKAAALVAAQEAQAQTEREAQARAEQEAQAQAAQDRQASIELALHKSDQRRFRYKLPEPV